MTVDNWRRFVRIVLVLLATIRCVMCARGQVDSENIVGYGLMDPETVFTSGFFRYALANGGATIVDYTGSDSHMKIPETIDGHPVSAVSQDVQDMPLSSSPFGQREHLRRVSLPASVKKINNGAFGFCKGIVEVSISSNVTHIGDYAFFSSGLSSITIPASVTHIGKSAFNGCTGLTSITVPVCVTNLGEKAFFGCTRLPRIDVDAINTTYSSLDGVLFNKARTRLICYPAGKAGSYTVPASVTSISRNAFSGCAHLAAITIPNRVTSIGCDAFSGCADLTGVYFDGDAPHVDSTGSLFWMVDRVTVYHRPGAKGWGTAFSGRPVKVWEP